MMPFAPQQQYARPSQPAPQYNVPAAMANNPGRPGSPAMTTTPQRAQPLVRLQSSDEPTPVRPAAAAPKPTPEEQHVALTLPAPEQLGVAAAGAVDWASAHARLEKLGVTCFHQEKLPGGVCRVTCVLAATGAKAHRIDAEGSNAAEALHLALAQAERWAGRQ